MVTINHQKRRLIAWSARSTRSAFLSRLSLFVDHSLTFLLSASTRRANSQERGSTRRKAISLTSTNTIGCSTKKWVSFLSTCQFRLPYHCCHIDCAVLRQIYVRDSGQLRAWHSAVTPFSIVLAVCHCCILHRIFL